MYPSDPSAIGENTAGAGAAALKPQLCFPYICGLEKVSSPRGQVLEACCPVWLCYELEGSLRHRIQWDINGYYEQAAVKRQNVPYSCVEAGTTPLDLQRKVSATDFMSSSSHATLALRFRDGK